jgi:crossover junction endodeoxyribonuclease RusA
VAVALHLYPPDYRRRDLDNVIKAVLDALVLGGLLKDDSQVVELRVVKYSPQKPGQVLVEVWEVSGDRSFSFL